MQKQIESYKQREKFRERWSLGDLPPWSIHASTIDEGLGKGGSTMEEDDPCETKPCWIKIDCDTKTLLIATSHSASN
jgi:hypothetical protein